MRQIYIRKRPKILLVLLVLLFGCLAADRWILRSWIHSYNLSSDTTNFPSEAVAESFVGGGASGDLRTTRTAAQHRPLFINVDQSSISLPPFLASYDSEAPKERHRNVLLDTTIAGVKMEKLAAYRPGDTLTLNLFDDVVVTARFTGYEESLGSTALIWKGVIPGRPGSWVTLILYQGHFTSTIGSLKAVYVIVPIRDNYYHITETYDWGLMRGDTD